MSRHATSSSGLQGINHLRCSRLAASFLRQIREPVYCCVCKCMASKQVGTDAEAPFHPAHNSQAGGSSACQHLRDAARYRVMELPSWRSRESGQSAKHSFVYRTPRRRPRPALISRCATRSVGKSGRTASIPRRAFSSRATSSLVKGGAKPNIAVPRQSVSTARLVTLVQVPGSYRARQSYGGAWPCLGGLRCRLPATAISCSERR